MARGINKVILIGNLGKDPELRYLSNGSATCTANLATTEGWKDQQGNAQERTGWHLVVFYGRLAEIVNEYARKGTRIYCEGKLRTRKWQDKQGKDHYTTEIVASEMQLLSSNRNGTPSESQPESLDDEGPGEDGIPF